jgi:AraC-like DNA-binding protein
MSPHAVSVESVGLVLAALETAGWDRARCSRRLGLDADKLDPGGAILPRHTVALLELALEVGGPDFALAAGSRIPYGALGLLDHLCGAAPTARAALEDLCRYFRLVAWSTSLTLTGETLILALPPGLSLPHRRLLAELFFSFLVQRLGRRGPATPTLVGLPGDGVRAGPWTSTRDGVEAPFLVFAAADLERPVTATDPSLRALLEGYAARELERRPAVESACEQVRRVVLASLPGAAPSASAVARSLGVSERSLRRALQAEGQRFSEVRDCCLRAVAEQALLDPSRTIGEVGWLLGYSEPSAFHRAFRRWTGTTPQRFREPGRGGQ